MTGSIDEVAFGADPASPDQTRDVLLARAHPGFTLATLVDDVGLLLLDAPASAAPMTVAGAAVDPAGSTVRVVGFGRASADDTSPARKREGTAVVASATATSFRITPSPSQACEGDSGGPAFLDSGGGEELVGVVSSGDAACDGYTDFARAGAYLETFIAPFVDATADGSAATGERCFDDATCAAGSCRFPPDAPTIGYCTAPCGACPGAMACEDGTCVHPAPSPGAPGAACADGFDCDSEVCATPADGDPVCAERCVPDAIGCDDGFTCADDLAAPGSSACFATEEGGCGCRGGGPGAVAPWLVLAMLVGLPRRRRRV